jgi:hypothetical protein
LLDLLWKAGCSKTDVTECMRVWTGVKPSSTVSMGSVEAD